MTAKSGRKPVVPLKSKLKKDLGVPRLPDIKVRNAQKQRVRAPPAPRLDVDSIMLSEPTLETLANLPDEEPQEKTKEQLRRHYLRSLHKVIDQSDIIVLVLDARDPEGCRSRLVEEEVLRRESEGKKLVLVLNKIGAPYPARQRAAMAAISTPFYADITVQGSFIGAAPTHQHLIVDRPSVDQVAQSLQALRGKHYCRRCRIPKCRKEQSDKLLETQQSSVCNVAAQAGHTKELQSVQLERGMRIIDSPGVVFDDEEQKAGNLLLRNVVKVEDINDPIAVVEEILGRTPSETLQKLYNLPIFSSTLEFLTMAALSSGRLLKGGTPDITATAKQIINDWNHQKIPYYSEPPTIHPSSIPSTMGSGATTTIAPGAEQVGQAKILNAFSAPFSLPGLFENADSGAFGSGDVEMRDDQSADGDMDAEDGDMDEDGDVFEDAMDEDEFAAALLSRKRPRSPSPVLTGNTLFEGDEKTYMYRLPKRLRKQRTVEKEAARDRRRRGKAGTMQSPTAESPQNLKRKTPPGDDQPLPHIVHPMNPIQQLPAGYQYNSDFTTSGQEQTPSPPQGTPGGRQLSTSKRAEQNRKAQRAFRERRDQHVKQLESRSALLDAALASADEANRRWEECRILVDQLRVENAALRAALTQQAALLPGPPTPAVATKEEGSPK
ncbi:Proteophosphoglycan ppg4 [Mycena kentingensis (nom. inval.)]|nr:Proteophosphoglycan ppg4 [Mycena kentingensis (nom. inval.)]